MRRRHIPGPYKISPKWGQINQSYSDLMNKMSRRPQKNFSLLEATKILTECENEFDEEFLRRISASITPPRNLRTITSKGFSLVL